MAIEWKQGTICQKPRGFIKVILDMSMLGQSHKAPEGTKVSESPGIKYSKNAPWVSQCVGQVQGNLQRCCRGGCECWSCFETAVLHQRSSLDLQCSCQPPPWRSQTYRKSGTNLNNAKNGLYQIRPVSLVITLSTITDCGCFDRQSNPQAAVTFKPTKPRKACI